MNNSLLVFSEVDLSLPVCIKQRENYVPQCETHTNITQRLTDNSGLEKPPKIYLCYPFSTEGYSVENGQMVFGLISLHFQPKLSRKVMWCVKTEPNVIKDMGAELDQRSREKFLSADTVPTICSQRKFQKLIRTSIIEAPLHANKDWIRFKSELKTQFSLGFSTNSNFPFVPVEEANN